MLPLNPFCLTPSSKTKLLLGKCYRAAETATDALYQALSSPNPDPQIVHTAIEEIRYLGSPHETEKIVR